MRKKKDKLRFNSKKQSAAGIAALVLAGIGGCCTVALVVIASRAGGESGLAVGICGIAVTVDVLTGFILALKALYERDISPAVPIIALTLNGILLILYLCMYILGF